MFLNCVAIDRLLKAAKKTNVLIADDNKKITRMLSRYLETKGFNCTVENDGRNALSLIRHEKFDVVLLDLAMPEFSGYDIIENLEKSASAGGGGSTPLSHYNVILFTASSIRQEEVDDLLRRGAKDCLRKPVSMNTVIQTINHVGDVSVASNVG